MSEFFYENLQWLILILNLVVIVFLAISLFRKKLSLYNFSKCKIDSLTAYLTITSIFIAVIGVFIDFSSNELIWCTYGIMVIFCDLLYFKEKNDNTIMIDGFMYRRS